MFQASKYRAYRRPAGIPAHQYAGAVEFDQENPLVPQMMREFEDYPRKLPVPIGWKGRPFTATTSNRPGTADRYAERVQSHKIRTTAGWTTSEFAIAFRNSLSKCGVLNA